MCLKRGGVPARMYNKIIASGAGRGCIGYACISHSQDIWTSGIPIAMQETSSTKSQLLNNYSHVSIFNLAKKEIFNGLLKGALGL